MTERSLTSGEKTLLQGIFGATLPYDDQKLRPNDWNLGGKGNSITFSDTPRITTTQWQDDYSDTSKSYEPTSTFVHEMAHVWQYWHGLTPTDEAVNAWWKYDDYDDAYNYDLAYSSRLAAFNFEAQAAIVEDYYRLTVKQGLLRNRGTKKALADYQPYIVQVQAGGSPYRKKIPYIIPKYRR